MDYAACNVVYVDRAAREDRLVKSDDPALAHLTSSNGEVIAPVLGKTGFVDGNLHTLLETFSEVYICSSGESCISKLSELNKTTVVDLIPTLVLVDIPYDDDELEEPLSRDFRTPSPNSRQEVDETNENQTAQSIYGIELLQWLAGEIKYQSLSRLFVPVAVVAIPHHSSRTRERTHTRSRSALSDQDPFGANPRKTSVLSMPLDQIRTMKYLDVGAVDVLTSPLLRERLPSLAIHAYRSHKDALKDQEALLEMKRGRKRSWVGLDDQKPYAYLREAMVSGLMDGICKLGGEDEPFAHVRITVALNAREKIADSIGTWDFSAHEFTDDELLHAALLMLQHALTMPQLEQWRISTEQLTGFLVASRSAYNAFVPYHNFRHVVDVLQAVFYFLVQLGRLPPYPSESASEKIPLSPLAELIRPFDALTLLITAIGHDVGHPGVNNAFLVTLNAPLAQLYNDRSVLESFHCAAYSQILRRHWSAAFQGVEMRKLMIDSILATDMGLHFDYMQKLGFLQDKLHANGGTDGFNVRTLDEQRTLACSLLIKCADISNVARKYHVAEQWTMILTDEFARQASMETDLGIPSALFAAPVREIIELGKSQINFMNMFAIPLFQGVTDVMPAMGFCVDELERNKVEWEQKIAAEQAARHDRQDSIAIDGAFSPRNMSLATPSDVTSSRRVGSVTATVVSNPESHQRIRALLSQTSFPGNRESSGSPVESLQEDPEESPSSSVGASPSELLALPKTSVQRRSSKPLPSQLQLSYATASAPASLGQPSGVENQNGSHGTLVNGLSVQPSLVTDAVIADTPMSSAETVKESHQQRGSETTNGSAATSATTGNMPLSPSTKATSIMSHDESERGKSSSGQTARKGMLCTSNNSQNSGSTAGAESFEGYDAKQMSADAAKKLTKKPSRFRLPNFFKRNKSPSPAIPSGADGRTTMNRETEDAYTA